MIIEDRRLARRDEAVFGDHLTLSRTSDDHQAAVVLDVQPHLLTAKLNRTGAE